MRLMPSMPLTAQTVQMISRIGMHQRQVAVKGFVLRPLMVALGLSLSVGLSSAATFTIAADSTAAQTLGAGANQSGTVNAGKSLTVSGTAVAVSVTGNSATLTNLGTIQQTGTGRVIRDNTGVTGLTITNGSVSNSAALMQTADGDVIQMNKSPASVTLNNYGSMISLNASAGGSQAVDFAAIGSGANTVNNYAGGLMKASEADSVRPGVNGAVNNWGSILSVTALGNSSDGVDLQNNSGASITNYSTGMITGGRHGITGGALDASASFIASVTNLSGGVIQGSNGSGINLDGFNAKQLVTVVNSGRIIGKGVTGDGDGIDVDGLVNITNTSSGIIRSVNAFSVAGAGLAFSEGITVGGGTITNAGLIEGLVNAGNSNAVGRGITLSGNDITTGALAGTREGLYGNAIVTNQAGGMIRGQTDSAIVAVGAASGYTVTITNQAGATIQGGSNSAAAIRTGLDRATINNSGVIDGSSSGRAIEMGVGNNTLNISGGQAVVLGDINGGVGGHNTMTIQPGVGNSFAYAGVLSNFDSVEIQSGTVSFSGISTYAGTTLISNGVLELIGANRLSADSALAMNGGTLKLSNAGGANGLTLSSLSLGADSVIDLGGSSLTFGSLSSVVVGATLSIVDYLAGVSPLYAIRVAGDMSANASFQSLLAGMTINGQSATYHFDGIYTDVTAVPEPQSVVLLLAGLGLICAMVRRRKI